MAREEAGGVGAAVDVGGDDAVEVAPADDDAEGDAAFVDSCGRGLARHVDMSMGRKKGGGSPSVLLPAQTMVLAMAG